MRFLGLAWGGVLARPARGAAQVAPRGWKMGPAAAPSPPAIAQVPNGNGPGGHPALNAWSGGGHQVPGHPRQWSGGPGCPPLGADGIYGGGGGPLLGGGAPRLGLGGPGGGGGFFSSRLGGGPRGGGGGV